MTSATYMHTNCIPMYDVKDTRDITTLQCIYVPSLVSNHSCCILYLHDVILTLVSLFNNMLAVAHSLSAVYNLLDIAHVK